MNQHEIGQQVDRAEELLTSQLSAHRVKRILMEEFSISRPTAERRIKALYDRWREESTRDRQTDREQCRRSFQAIAHGCLLRKTVQRDCDGYRLVPDPDYKHAIQAIDRLCRLEGHYEHDRERDRTAKGLVHFFATLDERCKLKHFGDDEDEEFESSVEE